MIFVFIFNFIFRDLVRVIALFWLIHNI